MLAPPSTPAGPPPSPAGPSPVPSPEGKGRNHRDTPMARMWANCCPLFVPTLAVTLCELCMPEAFCELEMCAKNLRELCALCERKTSTKYASRPVGVTSHTTPLSIRRGVGGEASVFSVCRRPSVGSKCAPKTSVNSVRSVREKTLHAPHKQPNRDNLTY